MNDTENNEQEPEDEGMIPAPGESSDDLAAPVDPPIIVQDEGSGNP
jgi:hypothetical protein